jgi:hypothetical protein
MIKVTAGNEDGTVALGVINFLMHVKCSGISICHSNIVIQSGVNMYSTQMHNYSESVRVQKHVTHVRYIAVFIDITRPQDANINIVFEKVQNCDYSKDMHHIQQLAHGCDLVQLDNTLGSVYFLNQGAQWLVIGVAQECPSPSCIDMNVQATPTFPGLTAYYWENTDLDYVNITVPLSAVTKLSWSNSHQCPTNRHTLEALCGINVYIQPGNFVFDRGTSWTIVDNFVRTTGSSKVTHIIYLTK